MWLFGKKNNDIKEEQELNEGTISRQDIAENCLKIAEIISGKDESVMSELRQSFANPQTYISNHQERLSEDYMLSEDEMNDYACDKWWILTDILEVSGYVCKRDWKDELQDFLYFLSETKRAVSENIRLDELDLPFSEEDDISRWSEQIDEELTNRNLAVGNIDMNSDEYTLFLCAVDELEALKSYADSIDHKITFAKEA